MSSLDCNLPVLQLYFPILSFHHPPQYYTLMMIGELMINPLASSSSSTPGSQMRLPPFYRMCQVMSSLNGNSLLSTLTQAAQVVSAAHSAATTAQSLGSLASLIHQFSSAPSSNDPASKSSIMSQLASVLNAAGGEISGSSSPTSSSSGSSSQVESGSSNFNPVLAVLDYLASNSNDKSVISSLLPARRKKPLDLEELASEAVAAVSVNKVPPTPCPSLEEYIAPVFARNYQGEDEGVMMIFPVMRYKRILFCTFFQSSKLFDRIYFQDSSIKRNVCFADLKGTCCLVSLMANHVLLIAWSSSRSMEIHRPDPSRGILHANCPEDFMRQSEMRFHGWFLSRIAPMGLSIGCRDLLSGCPISSTDCFQLPEHGCIQSEVSHDAGK